MPGSSILVDTAQPDIPAFRVKKLINTERFIPIDNIFSIHRILSIFYQIVSLTTAACMIGLKFFQPHTSETLYIDRGR